MEHKRTQILCNNAYRDFLAKLGELYVQKKNIDEQIAIILAQISYLNQITPELMKIEKSITEEHKCTCDTHICACAAHNSVSEGQGHA